MLIWMIGIKRIVKIRTEDIEGRVSVANKWDNKGSKTEKIRTEDIEGRVSVANISEKHKDNMETTREARLRCRSCRENDSGRCSNKNIVVNEQQKIGRPKLG